VGGLPLPGWSWPRIPGPALTSYLLPPPADQAVVAGLPHLTLSMWSWQWIMEGPRGWPSRCYRISLILLCPCGRGKQCGLWRGHVAQAVGVPDLPHPIRICPCMWSCQWAVDSKPCFALIWILVVSLLLLPRVCYAPPRKWPRRPVGGAALYYSKREARVCTPPPPLIKVLLSRR
jgi:hypothetical protein